MWKHFVSDYLTFTKKDRTGIWVVLVLMIIFIALPFLFASFVHPVPTDASLFKRQIDSLRIKQTENVDRYSAKNVGADDQQDYREPADSKKFRPKATGQLFSFDPNTLNADGWKRLGLRDKTIATIQKFVQKGGKFYKPEDLGKIWGLHPDEAERLIPFVVITAAAKETTVKEKTFENKTYPKPAFTVSAIDINTADTSAFIALPGIGSKLAQRIVTFREKLGGFYTVDQLAETYGVPDSTFQKIKTRLTVSTATVHRININTAGIDELKTHPYLKFTIANAIIQYRTQHGNYSKIEDLKKIMLITDDIFNKASPYLKVD